MCRTSAALYRYVYVYDCQTRRYKLASVPRPQRSRLIDIKLREAAGNPRNGRNHDRLGKQHVWVASDPARRRMRIELTNRTGSAEVTPELRHEQSETIVNTATMLRTKP